MRRRCICKCLRLWGSFCRHTSTLQKFALVWGVQHSLGGLCGSPRTSCRLGPWWPFCLVSPVMGRPLQHLPCYLPCSLEPVCSPHPSPSLEIGHHCPSGASPLPSCLPPLWACKAGCSQSPDPKAVLWPSPCFRPDVQGLSSGSLWMTWRGPQGDLENEESAIAEVWPGMKGF